MFDDRLQEFIGELWVRIANYESRFSREKFEICLLVSKTMQQYRAPDGLVTYVQRNQFDFNTYLFGHRVIFTDQEYIYNFNTGMPGLIEPVVCCKDPYIFPMEAKPGDYVCFSNKIKQVVDVLYEFGNRSIRVKDIPGEFSDEMVVDAKFIDWTRNSIEQWLDYRVRKYQGRDDWTCNVDNVAINNYLSSITISD